MFIRATFWLRLPLILVSTYYIIAHRADEILALEDTRGVDELTWRQQYNISRSLIDTLARVWNIAFQWQLEPPQYKVCDELQCMTLADR